MMFAGAVKVRTPLEIVPGLLSAKHLRVRITPILRVDADRYVRREVPEKEPDMHLDGFQHVSARLRAGGERLRHAIAMKSQLALL